MKTCGIITTWNMPDNYGSILQNYAVQEICKRNGFNPILIRDDFSKEKTLKQKLMTSLFRYGLVRTAWTSLKFLSALPYAKYCARMNRKRQFDAFCAREKNQTERIYVSLDDLKENLPPMDLYIVGSDQVWSTKGYIPDEYRDEIYARRIFLDFAPERAKRIACAVSFGQHYFHPALKQLASALIQKFDFVSVREPSGVAICRELGYDKAVAQIDPTFLLDQMDYRKLIKEDEEIPLRKYVLLYLLNNPSSFSTRKFYAWAKKKQLAVVYVNGNLNIWKLDFHKKTYASIPQWLRLISNAECVFTNSFHGTCFSILFHKQFMMIPQKRKFASQNERLENLITIFKLQERTLNQANSFDQVFEAINYDSIDSILRFEREHSSFVKYLKNVGIEGGGVSQNRPRFEFVRRASSWRRAG